MNNSIKIAVSILALVLLTVVSGCGDPRTEIFDPDTGRHAPGWLPLQHALAARGGSGETEAPTFADACKECHGADLNGGIAGVSCIECHLGSPVAVHPDTWTSASLSHPPYVQANGTESCSTHYCHGEDLEGVGDSGPACTSCHLGGTAAAHPASWTNRYTSHGPYVTENDASACANQVCHGQELSGVENSGPACAVCHAWPLDPGTPVVLTCGFCHGVPPDGDIAPNRSGTHAKHLALNGVTCSACHSGSSGDVNQFHPDLTDEVIMDPIYNSLSGTAVFDPETKTCANISCHGGPRTQSFAQVSAGTPTPGSAPESTPGRTPAWYEGTFTLTAVATSLCANCHVYDPAQSAEFNNFFSGKHFIHLYDQTRGPFPKYRCDDCHDIAGLLPAAHFTSLNTTTMEGPAWQTLRPLLNFDSATAGCNPGCHEPRNWILPFP